MFVTLIFCQIFQSSGRNSVRVEDVQVLDEEDVEGVKKSTEKTPIWSSYIPISQSTLELKFATVISKFKMFKQAILQRRLFCRSSHCAACNVLKIFNTNIDPSILGKACCAKAQII